MYFIKRTFNPEIFQGKNKKKNYFEGWYYKLIDSKKENVLAIIPGVSFDMSGTDVHAFIQVMDAYKRKVYYLRYDISHFKFKEDKFEVEIANNYFSDKKIELDIDKNEVFIKGGLTFENIISYPKTITMPGIMGPFAFIPFMECYHGIVNIHHDIHGILQYSSSEVDFSNGYGYIEKDWGSSFPEAWLWLQSNHFITDDVSIMFSVAKIPWFGRSFLGFISFVRIKDKIYNFSTYTGAKIIDMAYIDNSVYIKIKDRRYRLHIEAKHSNAETLMAPKNGLMKREILESLTAVVKVKLMDRDGVIIYEGQGVNAGLEIEKEIFNYFDAVSAKEK